jgi:hypothetical protein
MATKNKYITKEKLQKLYKKNILIKDIAIIFKCKECCVRKYLKRYKIPLKSEIRQNSLKKITPKILTMYKNGNSSGIISKKLNKPIHIILNVLKKQAITTRNYSEAQKLLKQTGKKNPNYRHGKCCNNNYCLDCGKKIDKLGRSIRCYACRGKYYSGKKCPIFIHGHGNIYPKKFSYKLKNKIRKRDNYTCQRCGMKEQKHLNVYGKKTHVHHIDYNKENCKENNLITLCQKCHNWANHNRDYWFAYYQFLIKRSS